MIIHLHSIKCDHGGSFWLKSISTARLWHKSPQFQLLPEATRSWPRFNCEVVICHWLQKNVSGCSLQIRFSRMQGRCHKWIAIRICAEMLRYLRNTIEWCAWKYMHPGAPCCATGPDMAVTVMSFYLFLCLCCRCCLGQWHAWHCPCWCCLEALWGLLYRESPHAPVQKLYEAASNIYQTIIKYKHLIQWNCTNTTGSKQ